MTRGASAGPAVLGAKGQCNHGDTQRNRSITLHKEILRPIAKCSRAVVQAVDGQVRNACRIPAVVAARIHDDFRKSRSEICPIGFVSKQFCSRRHSFSAHATKSRNDRHDTPGFEPKACYPERMQTKVEILAQ
jgi:hypothetical protein